MKIGVIGAGTMGQGIAKAFAQVEGNTVALCDIKQEWAENGLAKIKKGYEKLVAKGKMTQEKVDAIVAAITPGLKEDLCADCDLVVEAAFEDMKVKQTTFGNVVILAVGDIGFSKQKIRGHVEQPCDLQHLLMGQGSFRTTNKTADGALGAADLLGEFWLADVVLFHQVRKTDVGRCGQIFLCHVVGPPF